MFRWPMMKSTAACFGTPRLTASSVASRRASAKVAPTVSDTICRATPREPIRKNPPCPFARPSARSRTLPFRPQSRKRGRAERPARSGRSPPAPMRRARAWRSRNCRRPDGAALHPGATDQTPEDLAQCAADARVDGHWIETARRQLVAEFRDGGIVRTARGGDKRRSPAQEDIARALQRFVDFRAVSAHVGS